MRYSLVLIATLFPQIATAAVCNLEEIQAQFPNATVTNAKNSVARGFCEFVVGVDTFYISHDGRFLMQGDLIDLDSQVNLTENQRSSERARAIQGIRAEDMIVFAAKDPKYTLTVFTDANCPYCQRFHDEIADLNKKGITVNYLAYPRTGPGSPSWAKLVNIWCSQNRHEALTRAKAGEDITGSGNCDSSLVRQQQRLGSVIGVTGTPAIITESGEMISGYQPASVLHARLAENGTSTHVSSARRAETDTGKANSSASHPGHNDEAATARSQQVPNRPPSSSGQSSVSSSRTASKGSCPNDLSYLRSRIQTPELRAEVSQTVEDGIRKAGSLDRAIILTRAQITKYQDLLAEVEANPQYRQNPNYASYVTMIEDGIMVNEAYLDAMMCRKGGTGRSAGTGNSYSDEARRERAARRRMECEDRKYQQYSQCMDSAMQQFENCWDRNRSPYQIGAPSQCVSQKQNAERRCESIQNRSCN